MSALDELVDALQASLSSVQTARAHGVQATAAGGRGGCRDRAVAETEALGTEIEEAAAFSRPLRRG